MELRRACVAGPTLLDHPSGAPSGVYFVQHRPSGLVKLGSSGDVLERARTLARLPGVEGPTRVLWTGRGAAHNWMWLAPGIEPHLLIEGLLLLAFWRERADQEAKRLLLPHYSEWRRPTPDVVACARMGRVVVGRV